MKLNFHPAFQTNTIFNPYGLNKSGSGKSPGSTDAASQDDRRDVFILSPQGGLRSHLNNLIKLKTELTDRKNALLKTVKDGGSMETIKSQLDFYDEQLENIDEQIAEAMAREAEKQTEKNNEQKTDKEPKTRKEILDKRMTDITVLSNDIENVETIDSAKTALDGRIKVLKSELKLDRAHDAESSDGKLEHLRELEKRSKKLDSEIGTQLIEIAEEEIKNTKPEEVIENDKADSNTDTISAAKILYEEEDN